ncbi:MAG: MlaD family protein [Solirubrobacteraceae bacterium]
MKITKEVKIGLIGLLTIISLFFLINFLKGKNLFSANNNYYAVYSNVNGLVPSKIVYLNGFQVGKIEDIYMHPKMDGRLIVKISVKKNIVFSKKSTMEIFENGLVGGPALRINFSNIGPVANTGDRLEGIIAGSLTDVLVKQIEPLKEQALKATKSLDSVLISTNKLLDEENTRNLKQILKNVDKMIINMNLTAESANSLVNNNSNKVNTILDNANKMIVTTEKTINTVNGKVEKLDLEKSMAKLDSTLVSLNSILAKVDNNQGTVGRLINNPELYDNLAKTSLNLQELIVDLKANPNKYVQISVFGK